MKRRQWNHRVAGIDQPLEDDAAGGCSDDRLHLTTPPVDPALTDQIQVVVSALQLDPGELEGLTLDVLLLAGGDSLFCQLGDPCPLGLGPLEPRFGGVYLSFGLHQLGGGGVGCDLEQRIARVYPITHIDHTPLDDTRDLGLDLELEPGLDLSHGHRLLGDLPPLDLDELELLLFLAPALQPEIGTDDESRHNQRGNENLQQSGHRTPPGRGNQVDRSQFCLFLPT